MSQAILARDEVLAAFERTRIDFLVRAREIARRICRSRGVVSSDDVRAELDVPSGIDPRVMGAVFHKSEFVPVGFIQSARSECHGRPIRTFRMR